MLKLSVSQVQKQLSAILSETVLVMDKKHHEKKAVILPYHIYKELVEKNKNVLPNEEDTLEKYVGILSRDFETDDAKYLSILK